MQHQRSGQQTMLRQRPSQREYQIQRQRRIQRRKQRQSYGRSQRTVCRAGLRSPDTRRVTALLDDHGGRVLTRSGSIGHFDGTAGQHSIISQPTHWSPQPGRPSKLRVSYQNWADFQAGSGSANVCSVTHGCSCRLSSGKNRNVVGSGAVGEGD